MDATLKQRVELIAQKVEVLEDGGGGSGEATGSTVILTGYTKGTAKSAVVATDSVNKAIAKHENRIDDVVTTIGNINSVLEEVL